jgi:hypothetical protein
MQRQGFQGIEQLPNRPCLPETNWRQAMAEMTRDDILKKYVSDMHAVAKHVLEAFERQQQDADVQSKPEARRIIDKIVTVMRSHHTV